MLNSDLPNINYIGHGSEARAVIARLIGYVETHCGAESKAAVIAFLNAALNAATARLGGTAPSGG